MDEKKTTIIEEIENSMACSAFAEAGEPCPIGCGEKTEEPSATSKTSKGERGPTSMSIEDTMACIAFAEAGEPCPIGREKGPD